MSHITICDIDGVIADVTDLLPLIQTEGIEPDYKTYYERIGEAKPIWLGKKTVLSVFSEQRDAKEIVNILKSRQNKNSDLWSSVACVTVNPEAIPLLEPKGLFFVTGRNEVCKKTTKEWLVEQGITTNKKFAAWLTQYEVGRSVGYDIDLELCEKKDTAWGDYVHLYMRSKNDFRPAHEVKKDLIAKIQYKTQEPYSNMVVYEDDADCVKMYQDLGCYVFHVKHEKARS
jgi:dihydrofolate reductase